MSNVPTEAVPQNPKTIGSVIETIRKQQEELDAVIEEVSLKLFGGSNSNESPENQRSLNCYGDYLLLIEDKNKEMLRKALRINELL